MVPTAIKGQLFSLDQPGPTVLAFVGPNGSGKSSIVEKLGLRSVRSGDTRFKGRIYTDDEAGITILPIVNPDEIARALLQAYEGHSLDEINLIAAKTAEEIRNRFANHGVDFAFETVGSHPSKVEFLEELRGNGWTVGTLFVGTNSADINIRRVAARVRAGGHDVPKDKILSRYERCMQLLPRFFLASDFMTIYDNSIDVPQDSGMGPKLLLIKRGDSVELTTDGYESMWLNQRLKGLI